LDKRQLSIVEGSDLLDIVKPIGQNSINISVIVEQNNFEVVGGKYWGTIDVPLAVIDSKPLIFILKPYKEGLNKIVIHFIQLGIPSGKIVLETNVLPKSGISQSDTESQFIDKPWHFIKPSTRPYITLFIYEKKRSPDYQFDVLIDSEKENYQLHPVGTKTLPHDVEKRIQFLFKDIENNILPTDRINNRLKGKGRLLYKELFPEELKNIYWQIKDRIRSIHVLSNDPYNIPWEMIRPYDERRGLEDPFLCEQFAFSRRTTGKETIFCNEKLQKVMIVIPSETDLESAKQELEWLKQLADNKKIDLHTISDYKRILNALENGEYDIYHFSTHGEFKQSRPTISQILLDNDHNLTPEDISPM